MNTDVTEQFSLVRHELQAYLCRLVIRPAVAEELVQTTFLRCHEAAARLPESAEGIRAWLFKVATHLAFDELKRHGAWRETALVDLKDMAVAKIEFVEATRALSGTPETRAIAREHLTACLACTLRNLPEQRAAALLLKEMHGFSVDETAELINASPTQVKNWLQEARAYMNARYGKTCALITKAGVCHQCIELDNFMAAGQGNPLADGNSVDDRIRIARTLNARSWGAWHRAMFDLIDELAN